MLLSSTQERRLAPDQSVEYVPSLASRERKLHGRMGDRYFPVTLTLPTGIYTGVDVDSPHLPCSIEAPATYTFDGEVGHGWIERIRRVGNLRTR